MQRSAALLTPNGDRRLPAEEAWAAPRAAIRDARATGGLAWFHLVDPDAEEMTAAGRALDLNPLAVEDAASGRQQPKVQRFPQHLFIVLWDLVAAGGDGRIGVNEVFLFLGEGWLLTVQHSKGMERTDLAAVLEHRRRDTGGGAMAAAYAIMADAVTRYSQVTADVEAALEELEERVFDPESEGGADGIFLVRQNIGRIDRAVSSLAASLVASRDHFGDFALEEQRVEPFLRDLIDDVSGTATLAADQARALDAVVSSYENRIAARQNQDMRTISAFAALLAIPTVVAGFYGMNVDDLPPMQWEYGWMVIVGLVVVLDLLAFWAFKRRNWL